MRCGAEVVNTTRGPVVDEAALAAALAEGEDRRRLALDVDEREPEAQPGLIGLENVVLVPHLGSATTEARGREELPCATRSEPPCSTHRVPDKRPQP